MSNTIAVRRLRPSLSSRFRLLHRVTVRGVSVAQPLRQHLSADRDETHDYQKRVEQLSAQKPQSQWYPRIADAIPQPRLPISRFHETYGSLEPGQTDEGKSVTVAGRVKVVRLASSKLFFVELEDDVHSSLQVVCSFRNVEQSVGDLQSFKDLRRVIRRGDFYGATGHPHRTPAGELSIKTTSMPNSLAPALHQIPEQLDDAETRARHRHVDMLVNPAAIATLRLRHLVEQHLHAFLSDRGFTSVRTPILEAGAGGAVARPFSTISSELPGHPLHMRIAPELWLKRLVVGGLNKVYEIGPAFRNEGVDATHNPEFHICEFYEAFATLEDLIAVTETMLKSLALRLTAEPRLSSILAIPSESDFAGEFPRLEFVPELQKCLGTTLPDLSTPDAVSELRAIFQVHSLVLPKDPTLPRLLDALSGHFLEPMTHGRPTFITNPPAALSPLAKHFTCPTTGQRVAARAELFFRGREYANMYEEENSPFAQRANFEAQARFKIAAAAARTPAHADVSVEEQDGLEEEAGAEIDESYVRALEWGLPPTGGWGCGIDRLVMLFGGRERIADVLAFGTLRNVAGLGGQGKGPSGEHPSRRVI